MIIKEHMTTTCRHLILLSLIAISLLSCSGSLTRDVWASDYSYRNYDENKICVQFLSDNTSVVILKQKSHLKYEDDDVGFLYLMPSGMPRDAKSVTKCTVNENIYIDHKDHEIKGDGKLTLIFGDDKSFTIASDKVGDVVRSPLEVAYASDKIQFHRTIGYRGEDSKEKIPIAKKILLTPATVVIDVTAHSAAFAVEAATAPLWLPLLLWIKDPKRKFGY
jgi:hypothetical protein